jgi:N-acetylneuraminic acid mutarotase
LREKDETIAELREGGKAPREMNESFCAAVDGSTLYIMIQYQGFSYAITTSSWSQLPDTPTFDYSLVIINNILTLVGGRCSGTLTITNQLFSLTGEGSGRRWTEKLPRMPTKRYGTTVLSIEAALIVAGGRNNESVLSGLQTVEMMNTKTLQWSTAADLPQPLKFAPSSVCGDHIYVLGKSNMYTCSLQALIQSSKKSFLASFRNRGARVWKEVAAPPVTKTTCVSFHSQLLVIGGKGSDQKSTSAVHMYNPTTDSWEVISHMGTPRYNCIAAVLPNNQLMVVGGYTGIVWTDSVEFASI